MTYVRPTHPVIRALTSERTLRVAVLAALAILVALVVAGCCYGEAARNAELARAGKIYFEAAGPDFATISQHTAPAPGLDDEDKAALARAQAEYARAIEAMRRLFGGKTKAEGESK